MNQCRFCKNPITPGASFCAACRHYQSPLRNGILYLSGTTALIALLGSAFVYISSAWADAQSKWLGNIDLKVVSATNDRQIVLLNRGSRDVFVSHVNFESSNGKTSREVNKIVPANQLVTAFDETSKSDWNNRPFRCITGELAKRVREANGGLRFMTFIYFSEGHPSLKAHFNLSDSHITLKAKATLFYMPFGDFEERTIDIACTGIAVQMADKNGEYSDEITRAVMETSSVMGHQETDLPPAPSPAYRRENSPKLELRPIPNPDYRPSPEP